jgi:hypothetical protein
MTLAMTSAAAVPTGYEAHQAEHQSVTALGDSVRDEEAEGLKQPSAAHAGAGGEQLRKAADESRHPRDVPR